MATDEQKVGALGESLVCRLCSCPKCKKTKTLKRLITNFKCADVICEFCTFVAQVKATRVKDIEKIPTYIRGAAWVPQFERMQSSIYIPLYLVLLNKNDFSEFSISYLSPDVQKDQFFKPRNPLKPTAKRANWQGFMYKFSAEDKNLFVKLWSTKN